MYIFQVKLQSNRSDIIKHSSMYIVHKKKNEREKNVYSLANDASADREACCLLQPNPVEDYHDRDQASFAINT